MKKTIIFLLALVMIISTMACGEAAPLQTEAIEATETTEATEATVFAPEKHITNMDKVQEKADRLDHPDTIYFAINDYYNMESEGSRVILSHFETYEQLESYTCGPSSAWMVLNYFDKETAAKYTELDIAGICGSTGGGVGTSAGQIADFFENEIGWHVEYYMSHDKKITDLQTFMEMIVKWNIDEGHPVIVDWCISSGHWTTIIGYDTMGTDTYTDDVLIMADSGDGTDGYLDGYMVFSASRFFSMWKESTPFDGEEVYRQEYVVAYPEGK